MDNRWAPVFSKYVQQIASRVDALGGNSKKIMASPSGEWKKVYRKCFILALATAVLIAMLVVSIGTLSGGLQAIINIPIFALLIGVSYYWIKYCRPQKCRLLRTLIAGVGTGAIVLAILAVLGISTPQPITTLVVSAGIIAVTAIVGWVKRCLIL